MLCYYGVLYVHGTIYISSYSFPRQNLPRTTASHRIIYNTAQEATFFFVYPDSDERRMCCGKFSSKSIFLLQISSLLLRIRYASIRHFFLLSRISFPRSFSPLSEYISPIFSPLYRGLSFVILYFHYILVTSSLSATSMFIDKLYVYR